MPIKKRSQVRAEFAQKGISMTAWAVKNGFAPNLVINIITDDDEKPVRKCVRGASHNIACALGIKEGEISRPSQAGQFAVAA